MCAPRGVQGGRGAPGGAEGPAGKPRRAFTQVIAGARVGLFLVALTGAVASRRLAEAQAVNDAAKTADLFAGAGAQSALQIGRAHC